MATVGVCLVFELRKFRSAIHQGHRRLVTAVNFGHKKNPAEAGLSRWLSVSSYVLKEVILYS